MHDEGGKKLAFGYLNIYHHARHNSKSESVAKPQLSLYWNTPQYAVSELDHIKSIRVADLAYWTNDRANNQPNTIQGMIQI